MEPFVWSQSNDGTPAVLRLEAWTGKMPGLSAGFTTRIGGVSEGPYDSLNCGLHVADQPERVIENRKRTAAAAGFDFSAWTSAEQVHGSKVVTVTAAERGRGRDSLEDVLPGADAMVTDVPGICLAAFFADCVPLYFLDPGRRVIGIAHAGWKGTVAAIAARTVEAMQSNYGCRPEHIFAAIGPSIGGCCYEVDEQVLVHVRKLEGYETAVAPPVSQEHSSAGGKRRLDLKELNRQIMIKAGIKPEHIEISRLCTACRTDLFYSHRKEKGKTGRMIGWIGINPA